MIDLLTRRTGWVRESDQMRRDMEGLFALISSDDRHALRLADRMRHISTTGLRP